MSQPGPPGISTAEPFLVLPENRFAYTAVTGIGNATAEPPPVLYLYGPSAENIIKGLKQFRSNFPLCKNSTVRVMNG